MKIFESYNNLNELITVSEAAKELGTNKNNVYKYLKSGMLKGIRYGEKGNWHIPRIYIEEFMNNNIR